MLAWLWKHLFCRFFHNKYRCWPEVWRSPTNWGPWHCEKCYPCSEQLDKFLSNFKTRHNYDV